MTRKLTLVAGVLFTSVFATSLLAQTSAAPKTAPTSSMQHPSAAAKSAQQDTTTAGAAGHTKMKHAVWTKDQIKEAQEGLTKAGFYKGKETGVVDKRTRKAIRAYQKANKLPVTGRLSDDLLTRLKSA